jgi:ribosomal-protein-alanine N-acetyltransferase
VNAFHIRTLHQDDAGPLLQFEQDNRHWFERHIASRGEAFYSPGGVREHIQQFLDAHANGTLHPCVILAEDGAIIGRANLKDIDLCAGTAEVGYRIAESQVGKGLATHAVRHLVDLARSSWQLKQLFAYVADRNRASARVLEKCMFTRQQVQEDCASGRPASAIVMVRRLDGESLCTESRSSRCADGEGVPKIVNPEGGQASRLKCGLENL